jgi:hypothetical protein
MTVAALTILPATAPAAGTLKGDYQLEGNHSSSCGAPPNLIDVGPGSNTFATEIVDGSTNGVLTFPEDNGLNLNTQGILPQDRFTVIMQFRLVRVASETGYVSLLVFDSDPPTSDSGRYVHQGSLDFYDDMVVTKDHEEPSPSVAPGTYIEVALTRDGSGQVKVYANGAPRISYDDSPNSTAVLLSNAIEFFKEHGTEESAGAVARIRVYDDALSAAEVSAPPACPQGGGGGGGGGGGAPAPDATNDISFGKVKKNKRKGTAKLTVNVPGTGELDLAKTKKVKPDDESAEDAGKEKLAIKPKGKAKKKLNSKGKAKVKAEVTFTPDGGTPNTEDKKIKLVKR